MIKVNKDVFMMDQFYHAKSIIRAKNILKNLDVIAPNIAQVEVDTVVYIKNPNNIKTTNFVGKKIYLQMFYLKSGTVTVEYNKKTNLEKLDTYNMVKDETIYQGSGTELVLQANEIAIFELDEGLKIKEINSEDYLYILVSKYGGIK